MPVATNIIIAVKNHLCILLVFGHAMHKTTLLIIILW